MNAWGRREYGKTFEAWPKDEAGQPVEPAFLTQCSPLDMEEEMIRSMLEAYGIPCLRDYPGDGAFGRVIMGASGTGVDIYVPKTMLEEAKMLIEGEENDEEL